MVEALHFIFLVCIGVGLGIPLLSVLLGLFGSLANADFGAGGHSADFGGTDLGSADLSGVDFNGVDLDLDLGVDPGGAGPAGVNPHGAPAAGGTDASTGNTIPMNFMCLCFSLVVFGAVGKLLLPLMAHPILTAVILLALLTVSFGAYVLIYRYIVRPLQRNNPRALRQWDIFGSKGKLTLRITDENPGTISLKDSTGAMISYRATAKRDVLELWDGVIPQGAEVIVVDLDPGTKLAYVRPVDTFDNHSLKHPK